MAVPAQVAYHQRVPPNVSEHMRRPWHLYDEIGLKCLFDLLLSWFFNVWAHRLPQTHTHTHCWIDCISSHWNSPTWKWHTGIRDAFWKPCFLGFQCKTVAVELKATWRHELDPSCQHISGMVIKPHRKISTKLGPRNKSTSYIWKI